LREIRCAKSDEPCQKCEQNPTCPIYGERIVLTKQLKSLLKKLDEIAIIIRRILELRGEDESVCENVSACPRTVFRTETFGG
jgi:hypothetical protein